MIRIDNEKNYHDEEGNKPINQAEHKDNLIHVAMETNQQTINFYTPVIPRKRIAGVQWPCNDTI